MFLCFQRVSNISRFLNGTLKTKVIQEYEHESHAYNFLWIYFVKQPKTARHTTALGS